MRTIDAISSRTGHLYANRRTLSPGSSGRHNKTLTIQAGTRIIGDFDVPGSSLFVLLRIQDQSAIGTAENPIVFTSERTSGRQAGDGADSSYSATELSTALPTILEGTGTGASNPQVNYAGGTNNADDSG